MATRVRAVGSPGRRRSSLRSAPHQGRPRQPGAPATLAPPRIRSTGPSGASHVPPLRRSCGRRRPRRVLGRHGCSGTGRDLLADAQHHRGRPLPDLQGLGVRRHGVAGEAAGPRAATSSATPPSWTAAAPANNLEQQHGTVRHGPPARSTAAPRPLAAAARLRSQSFGSSSKLHVADIRRCWTAVRQPRGLQVRSVTVGLTLAGWPSAWRPPAARRSASGFGPRTSVSGTTWWVWEAENRLAGSRRRSPSRWPEEQRRRSPSTPPSSRARLTAAAPARSVSPSRSSSPGTLPRAAPATCCSTAPRAPSACRPDRRHWPGSTGSSSRPQRLREGGAATLVVPSSNPRRRPGPGVRRGGRVLARHQTPRSW